jgi:hypothetical protein
MIYGQQGETDAERAGYGVAQISVLRVSALQRSFSIMADGAFESIPETAALPWAERCQTDYDDIEYDTEDDYAEMPSQSWEW